jgi:hypothetical protein
MKPIPPFPSSIDGASAVPERPDRATRARRLRYRTRIKSTEWFLVLAGVPLGVFLTLFFTQWLAEALMR